MLSDVKSPKGKHEKIQHREQVLGADSESEETQEALSEVLAERSTDSWRYISPTGKVGNDYLKDPL